MCRHLAWLGRPVTLADLLLDPPHSLLRQSYAPADMRGGGTVNVDGFGAGWYVDGRDEPVRYRRAVPIWADPSFAGLAGQVRSGAVLAAVRSATVGMPLVETACAPFTAQTWLFSHNGVVPGWPDSLAGPAAGLPVTDLLTLDAPTDSALLWALVLAQLRAGVAPGKALAAVSADVLAAVPNARLNLLLTDGAVLAATAVHHALAVRAGPDGVLVSSEPIDREPGWQQVPDRHLLVATASAVDISPLVSTASETASEEP